jgi:hypothetical protein
VRSHFRMLPFVLVLVVSVLTARAQTIDAEVDRTVWVGRGNVYYPVAIVGIDFDGKPGDRTGRPLQCRIPANLGNDWMTKMQVKVENRSPMTVTCVRVRLQIPRVSTEPGKTDVFIDNYLATIGMIPEEALKVSAGRVLQVDQQPLIEFRPGDAEYVPFAHFRREEGGSSSRPPTSAGLKVVVYPWDVFFEDGARWLAPSGYVRPNPDKPGTWVRVFSDPKQTPWTTNSK